MPKGKNSRQQQLLAGQAKLWSILIGVDRYEDENIQNLRYSAIDCQKLGEILKVATQHFLEKEIAIYHDKESDRNTPPPNFTNIISSLKALSNAGENDTVIFYFSGHAFLEKNSQKPVLCLKDTQTKPDVNSKEFIIDAETGLKVEELLTNYLANCPAKQQIVLLDACHSGGLSFKELAIGQKGELKNIKTEDNTVPQLVQLLRQKAAKTQGFYAILSCDRQEKSIELTSLKHGIFTNYLIKGIAGEAADDKGIIEADRLYKYVYYRTLEYIDKVNQQIRIINHQNRSTGVTDKQKKEIPLQTPRRIVEGTGEFIIGISPIIKQQQSQRLGLVINGLDLNENIIKLGEILGTNGKFKTRLLVDNYKEIRKKISKYLASLTTQTIFIYLRGKIQETEEGTNLLLLGDETRLSRDWLIEQIRESPIPQKIIILDFPEATNLDKWLKTLQLTSDEQQCIVAASSPGESSLKFNKILVEILSNCNDGLTVAQLITQLQRKLILEEESSDRAIPFYHWLSGATGVIDILLSTKNSEIFDAGICPYKGLKAFTKKDAFFFHGREKLREEIFKKLEKQSFLAVLGASGSGKSSLIQSGILPSIEAKELYGESITISFQPGKNPIRSLAASLVGLKSSYINTKEEAINELEKRLYSQTENGLISWLRAFQAETLVINIDQFEELFTLASDRERILFINLITETLLEAKDKLKIIITLRDDFISSCLSLPQLTSLVKNNNILVPSCLDENEYRQIIEKPAAKVGLSLESELVDILIEQTKNSQGSLPILQYILEQLWQNRSQNKLSLQTYQKKIGGLKGALENKANELYNRLSYEQKKCAKWIFLCLVHIGEEQKYTRRRILKSELFTYKYNNDLIELVLQKIIEAKLIVTGIKLSDRDSISTRSISQSDERDREVTVEIAHEILISNWSLLNSWLKDDRERLRSIRKIEQNAINWIDNQRDPSYLLRDAALDKVETIYSDYFDEITIKTQQYIKASRDLRKQLLKEKKRQEKIAKIRNNLIIFGLTLSLLITLNLTYQAFISEIETLNTNVGYRLVLEENFEGLLEALNTEQKINKIANIPWIFKNNDRVRKEKKQNQILLQEALYKIQEKNRLEEHKEDVYKVSFSHAPNGKYKYIATVSKDKSIKIWTPEGKLLKTLDNAHKREIRDVNFSHNNKYIASASWDGTVKLWEIKDKNNKAIEIEEYETFAADEALYNVTFSPNDKIIAAGGKDTLKLWQIEGKEITVEPLYLPHQAGTIYDLAFSPNGNYIAIAGHKLGGKNKKGRLILWNLKDKKAEATKWLHDDWIWSVTFSPDGKKIATASKDKTAKIWRIKEDNIIDDKPIITLNGHTQSVTSVTFSPDGKTLATASADTNIILWSAKGIKLETLKGHKDWVWDVTFSPDGKTLASTSKDTTVKLWPIEGKELRVIPGLNSSLHNISFSPDGRTIATASENDDLKIWQIEENQITDYVPIILTANTGDFSPVTWSPNGEYIAIATQDNSVKIWNYHQCEEIPNNIRHSGTITSLNFSHDSKYIATGSEDKTVKIWDFKAKKLIKSLREYQDSVVSVSFHPKENILATAGWDKEISFWTLDGKKISTLKKGYENGGVHSINFSPDGKYFATASEDKTVKIWYKPWQEKERKLISTIKGDRPFHSVSFSSDSKYIATGSEDKLVKIFELSKIKNPEVDSNKENGFNTYKGHNSEIVSINFNPVNNNILASSDSNGKLILWQWKLTQKELSKKACNWLKDYLNNNPHPRESKEICR